MQSVFTNEESQSPAKCPTSDRFITSRFCPLVLVTCRDKDNYEIASRESIVTKYIYIYICIFNLSNGLKKGK